jgi:TetR/AcrR family transcriptional regulator
MTVKPAMRHIDAARGNRRARRRRSPGRPAASALSVGADAIVLKACELLREVAPRELSIVRLARHANVDRSLIRYYFTDRSGLLLAAARHLFGVLRGRLDAVERRLSGDPETRIREMAVALLEFQIEHPYFHRLMIDEVVNSPKAEAQAFFRTFTLQGVQSFRDMAAATARRGGFRSHEGVFLYLAVIGVCEFFVTGRPILEVAFGEGFDAADINRQYAQFLRDYVIDGIRKR